MSNLFWILFSLFALVGAWRVILMSATFPLPQTPAAEPPAPAQAAPAERSQRLENISPASAHDCP